MHLPSILLLLIAAISSSAYPAASDTPDFADQNPAEANNSTGPPDFADQNPAEANDSSTGPPKDADYACSLSQNIIGKQVAEIARLKSQNISVPPYLAGYYTAVNSGRQAIGCPDTISVEKRDFTPLQQPCDVVEEQHDRMAVLINGFQKDHIAVAPFLAGFLSATLDEHEALGCPAFTNVVGDGDRGDVEAAGNDTTLSSD